ncbi:hypothetical protein DBV15_02217, partial [Temnothorax longispinosus]
LAFFLRFLCPARYFPQSEFDVFSPWRVCRTLDRKSLILISFRRSVVGAVYTGSSNLQWHEIQICERQAK